MTQQDNVSASRIVGAAWTRVELLGHPVKGTLELDSNGLWFVAGGRRVVALPWAEVSSIEVDSHEDVSRRITATRLVAVGVFALAIPKTRQACYIVAGSAQDTRFFRVAAPLMEVRAQVARFSTRLADLAMQPAAEALTHRVAAENTNQDAQRRTMRKAGYVCGFVIAPLLGWLVLTSTDEVTVHSTDVRCPAPLGGGAPERIPGRLGIRGPATEQEIRDACHDKAGTSRAVGWVLLLTPAPTGAWYAYRQKHPAAPPALSPEPADAPG